MVDVLSANAFSSGESKRQTRVTVGLIMDEPNPRPHGMTGYPVHQSLTRWILP